MKFCTIYNAELLFLKSARVAGLPLRDVRSAASMISSTCSFLPPETRRSESKRHQWYRLQKHLKLP